MEGYEENKELILKKYLKLINKGFIRNCDNKRFVNEYKEALLYCTIFKEDLTTTFFEDFNYAISQGYKRKGEKVETLLTLGMLHLFTPIKEGKLSPREVHLIASYFKAPKRNELIEDFSNDELTNKKLISDIIKDNKKEEDRLKEYDNLYRKNKINKSNIVQIRQRKI